MGLRLMDHGLRRWNDFNHVTLCVFVTLLKKNENVCRFIFALQIEIMKFVIFFQIEFTRKEV